MPRATTQEFLGRTLCMYKIVKCCTLSILKGDPLEPTLHYKSLYNTQSSKKVIHSITGPTHHHYGEDTSQVGSGHKSLMEVLNKVEGGHYQIACRLVFELTRPNYHGNLVVDHTNNEQVVQSGWS
ncbi:uncharacterized protein [Dysidea avara]|uniref:uncharacterized protein isoform X2 n=1 Tax=Dysidea avara TaxID=196820 RepID=UPI00331EEED9